MQYQQPFVRFWKGGIHPPTARMRSIPLSSLAALSLLCLPVCPGGFELRGQEVPENEVNARWSFVILTGMTGSGPSGDFGDALAKAGYDDTSESSWFSSSTNLIDHPTRPESGVGYEFEVGYRLSAKMTLAVSAGRTIFGSTTGYMDLGDEWGLGSRPSLDASLNHLSPALVYRIEGVRASLGPSIVQVRTWRGGGVKDEQNAVRIGASAGIAFSQKMWRALNFEFRARYRLVGSVDVGPFELTEGTLPQFQASFNHWQIGFGFGLHLGK